VTDKHGFLIRDGHRVKAPDGTVFTVRAVFEASTGKFFHPAELERLDVLPGEPKPISGGQDGGGDTVVWGN